MKSCILTTCTRTLQAVKTEAPASRKATAKAVTAELRNTKRIQLLHNFHTFLRRLSYFLAGRQCQISISPRFASGTTTLSAVIATCLNDAKLMRFSMELMRGDHTDHIGVFTPSQAVALFLMIPAAAVLFWYAGRRGGNAAE